MADTFELSYGPVTNPRPFRLPSDDLARWVEDRYPLADTPDAVTGYHDAQDTPWSVRLGMAAENRPPRPRLNELYIPPQRTQYPIFRGLMHKDDVSVIAAAAAAGTSMYLTMRAGAESTALATTSWGAVSYAMLPLPPRPLVGRDDVADLYLVTLVGVQFFYRYTYPSWSDRLPEDDSAYSDWINLLPSPSSAADAVYQYPSVDSGLYAQQERADVLYEQVMANLGRVSGTATWDDANTTLLSERTRWADYREVGGLFGAATGDYRTKYLPASFYVQFPKWVHEVGYYRLGRASPGSRGEQVRTRTTGEAFSSVYAKIVTLASLGAPYSTWLTLPDPTYVGRLRTSFPAVYQDTNPAVGNPDNQTACDDLAAQLVRDYLDANSLMVDETYRGIVPWDRGSQVHVLYSYAGPGTATTRVWRKPLLDDVTEFQHGTYPAPYALASPNLVYVSGGPDAGHNNYYPGYLWIDPSAGYNASRPVWLCSSNGIALTTGKVYGATIRPDARYWGSSSRTIWDTMDSPNPSGLTVNTTPVSGGTANGVLYSDGSVLKSAPGLIIDGSGNPKMRTPTTGNFVQIDEGSH